MDVAAILGALLGMTLAGSGYLLSGIVVTALPLTALAVAFARGRRPFALLPFSFVSWYFVLPVLGVTLFALRSKPAHFQALPFGLAIYYFGCITLVEGRARYSPSGSLFQLRTVERAERPIAYWLMVSVVFALCGIFLAVALASVSGHGGRRQ